MQKNIKWANKELPGLTHEDLLKIDIIDIVRKENGKISGQYTLENHLGIHTDDEELRREWATMGGEATIEQLLQWQKDNNHNIGEISKIKDEEWVKKISESLTGRKLSKQHIQNTKNGLKKYVNSLSKKQRSEKYSNDSASRKSLSIRTEILNLIETDTFATTDARKACEQYGLGNWKGFLKDKRIIKQIHKGTNQNNPSIYQKIN
jgi:hypothetical protein